MKKVVLLLMIVLGIFIWMYLNDDHKTTSAVSPINQVSLKTEPKSKANKTQPTQKVVPSNETVVKQKIVPIEDAASKNKWSYLDLYQKYRLAYHCYEPYQRYHYAKIDFDYIDQYTQTYQYRNHDGHEQPTESQIELLEQFLTQCLELQDQVATFNGFTPVAKNEDYWNATREFIEAMLLDYPAATVDEKYLKTSWQLRSTWLDKLDAVLLASYGDNTLSDEEISTIKQHIKDLRVERREQRAALGEAFTLEMGDEYSQMITSLQNQLKDQLHVDQKARAILLQQWDAQTLALEARLHNGPVESFQLITETLNLSLGHTFNRPNNNGYQRIIGRRIRELVPEYEIHSDRLMLLSEVRMPNHFDLLYPFAHLWYMCESGLPCGHNSEWMRARCLGFDTGRADLASCNQSYDRYLIDHLISPNQAVDINGLKTMLKELYGS
ncbi:MAG: hypothetical protein ACSHWU_02875 [Marinicella sp.]